jgi:trans-aconitate methyltransferase
MPKNMDWDEYYLKIQGRAPRPLLLDALKSFPEDAPQFARHAIDLGCGDGTETVVLLERGWHVLAIDGEPAAIRRVLEKVRPEKRPRLQTQVAKFEDVVLTPADLIHASLSLPFCEPKHFLRLWNKIVSAIKPGGRFAGQFFGVRDSWAVDRNMTFQTEEQVRGLLQSFEIKSFHELDEDGQATSGPKHWHVFTVIARKLQVR